jgi:hypothetical protein
MGCIMVVLQRSWGFPGQYREYDRYGQDWVIHVVKEPVQFTSASMQSHIYRVECPDANVGHVTVYGHLIDQLVHCQPPSSQPSP